MKYFIMLLACLCLFLPVKTYAASVTDDFSVLKEEKWKRYSGFKISSNGVVADFGWSSAPDKTAMLLSDLSVTATALYAVSNAQTLNTSIYSGFSTVAAKYGEDYRMGYFKGADKSSFVKTRLNKKGDRVYLYAKNHWQNACRLPNYMLGFKPSESPAETTAYGLTVSCSPDNIHFTELELTVSDIKSSALDGADSACFYESYSGRISNGTKYVKLELREALGFYDYRGYFIPNFNADTMRLANVAFNGENVHFGDFMPPPPPPPTSSSSSTAPPPPTSSSSSTAPPPPASSSSSTAPPPPASSSSSTAPPPPSSSSSIAPPPPTSSSSSSIAPPPPSSSIAPPPPVSSSSSSLSSGIVTSSSSESSSSSAAGAASGSSTHSDTANSETISNSTYDPDLQRPNYNGGADYESKKDEKKSKPDKPKATVAGSLVKNKTSSKASSSSSHKSDSKSTSKSESSSKSNSKEEKNASHEADRPSPKPASKNKSVPAALVMRNKHEERMRNATEREKRLLFSGIYIAGASLALVKLILNEKKQ
ncbi:MAG: hypothetical protein RR639_07815 [Hydrogenoanaerobacterium sp.]